MYSSKLTKCRSLQKTKIKLFKPSIARRSWFDGCFLESSWMTNSVLLPSTLDKNGWLNHMAFLKVMINTSHKTITVKRKGNCWSVYLIGCVMIFTNNKSWEAYKTGKYFAIFRFQCLLFSRSWHEKFKLMQSWLEIVICIEKWSYYLNVVKKWDSHN